MLNSPSVIKIGGSLLKNDLAPFWAQVDTLAQKGPVIIVHGGGIQSTRLSVAIGHQPVFVNGRRITSAIDLQVHQWAVRGEINSGLVAAAYAGGIEAVGISGADAGMIKVEKRPPWIVDGREVDFGWVGDVVAVKSRALSALLKANIVPVVAPLGIDNSGALYNVNADTVAVELAVAMAAEELIFVTSTGGILFGNPEKHPEILPILDHRAVTTGIEDGWISDGMHMKLTAAMDGIQRGISRIRITNTEGISNAGSGTVLIREAVVC